MGFRLLMMGILCLFWGGASFATPYELSYGGRLTETNGKPIAGPVDLRVTFFRSASGNDQVAVTLADFAGVILTDGIFQVPISLSAADFHTLFNGVDPAFIQVEDLTHAVTYPRQKFSAVPYALKVPVDGESITFNAAGQLSLGNGSNTLKLPNTAGAANKILKSDGAGSFVWADDLSGGGAGSITGTEIQDGSITNADISATAAIATSKISGLGSLATKNAVDSSDITDGSVTGTDIANGTITDANITATAAISYLKISGLGSAASKNVGTAAGDVAAGNHTHAMSAVTDAGSLATKNAVGSSDITDGSVTGTDIASGTITDANINASAAIAGSKVNPNFGSQNVLTTGTLTADTVKAGSHLQTATSAGAPNAPECDDPSEYGRLKTDTTNNKLYVCSASGWIVNASGSGYLSTTNNLSDVSNAATARTNLGLGSAATKNVGTTASDVAAGSHTHTMSAVTDAGSLATKNAVGSADITDGSIVNADINASAAIAGTKIAPDFGSQNIVTTGSVTADTLKATSYLQTATSAGAPVGTDCDNAAEYGRLKTDTTNNKLYVCSASGWIATASGADFLTASSNLSDVSNATTARTNLGLGSLAIKSAVASTDITDDSIVDGDINASAAIAGTKISPNFGSQNITTTGTISGDGSGLTNLPAGAGLTSCPSGFTMIGTSGKRGTFCIDTTQRTADTFLTGKTTCDGLSLTEGAATMCTHSEWFKACNSGSPPTGMTGDYEWVDEFSIDAGYNSGNNSAFIAGQASCSTLSGSNITSSRPFRCCVR